MIACCGMQLDTYLLALLSATRQLFLLHLQATGNPVQCTMYQAEPCCVYTQPLLKTVCDPRLDQRKR